MLCAEPEPVKNKRGGQGERIPHLKDILNLAMITSQSSSLPAKMKNRISYKTKKPKSIVYRDKLAKMQEVSLEKCSSFMYISARNV